MNERDRSSSPDIHSGPVPKVKYGNEVPLRVDQVAVANFLEKEGVTPEDIVALTIVLSASETGMTHYVDSTDTLDLSYPGKKGYSEKLNHLLYGSLYKYQEGKIPQTGKPRMKRIAGASLVPPIVIDVINGANGVINSPSRIAATVAASVGIAGGGFVVGVLAAAARDNLQVHHTIKLGEKLMKENDGVPLIYPRVGLDAARSGVTLDDVGGLESVKAQLEEVIVAFTNPQALSKWTVERPQGVLLYGEPGVGKTMLARALAQEVGAELLEVKSTDIYNKWLGDSMKNLAAVFEKARQAKSPLVLFFDELDSIISIVDQPGPGGGSQERNSVAGLFKQEMNSLAARNPHVLVVATTNSLDRIDDAIIRTGRFNYKIYVPMPDEAARHDIVIKQVEKIILTTEGEDLDSMIESSNDSRMVDDDLDLPQIVQVTDGMSGSQIAEIFRRLKIKRVLQESKGKEITPIGQQEILEEIRRFRTAG